MDQGHWCHVMERESFESEKVAEALNQDFISIKVDREERPDIDRIYMTFVQASTGHGGWPMTVFLTPDLKPVFGGTYFPGPDSQSASGFGRGPNFLELVEKLSDMWHNERKRLEGSSGQILAQLERMTINSLSNTRGDKALDFKEVSDSTFAYFRKTFDDTYGGFGSSPKFPTPSHLAFCLATRDSELHAMATQTLVSIAKGGIHDHLGGGFHRYSVTQDWNLPHFEKMLYDNGQLLDVYISALRLNSKPDERDLFDSCVRGIVNYMVSRMTDHEGGFHSSEDADSIPASGTSTEPREGAFYVWQEDELDVLLPSSEAKIVKQVFGVKNGGNVDPRHDPHGELKGASTLFLAQPVPSADPQKTDFENARKKMFETRERDRPRPHKDDKIITSWNGIMIAALANAATYYQSFDPVFSGTCLKAARNATAFIESRLYDPDRKRLRRVWREGPGDDFAFADDYANLIRGLLCLYQSTFDLHYVRFARTLLETQITLFHDSEKGGFFESVQGEDIVLRLKDDSDMAEPCSNSVTVNNLLVLGTLLDDSRYLELASGTIRAFESVLRSAPYSISGLVTGMRMLNEGIRQIMLVGPIPDAWILAIRNAGGPPTVLVKATDDEWLTQNNAIVKDIVKTDEGPTVYVCAGFTCGLPARSLEEIKARLGSE